MNAVTIKIIYDNCKIDNTFQEGWGFSCLVDVGHRKILFDTGADSQAFHANLRKLGIRCEEITDVVFSHKHGDHTEGLEDVVGKLMPDSRLFLPKRFPPKKIPSHVSTTIVKDFHEIDAGIFSLVLKGGFLLYEQALIITTPQGLVVITGCAHPGIVNLLETVKQRLQQPIHLVLGGFHLFKTKQSDVDTIIHHLKALPVQIAAPCHCSGEAAIKRFQDAFEDRFYKVGTGTVLTIENS